MHLINVASVLLTVLVVAAEKKIELQDIEEDNLKSEKDKDVQRSKIDEESATVPESLSSDFLKNSLFRYFERPTQLSQQQRYVQQYAVTELPEKSSDIAPKAQYAPQTAQQAMVGYLSHIPMQIYFLPQYYNEPAEQTTNAQPGVQYASSAVSRIPYAAPEQIHPQSNYIEVPAYVTPSGKAFIQQTPSSVGYFQYAQPTVTPAAVTVASVLTYPIPKSAQYPTALAAPPALQKGYYNSPQYADSNTIEDIHENEVESPKQYITQTESTVTYARPRHPEFPRYYNSRAPIREEQSHAPVSELPTPNPIIFNSLPPHLSHIPKALPMYRPLIKPVYALGGGLINNAILPRPNDAYGLPFKRRPTSLLDSYIPSTVQLEYMKRGYTRDPLSAYEILSGARHGTHHIPRHFERGFLPNQMYHTAAGGVTYGHYKRTPTLEAGPKYDKTHNLRPVSST